MSHELSGFDPGLMNENMEALAGNAYPGRGIILGVDESGESAVQVYWVMGRSENSRNRILVEETGRGGVNTVRTEAFDPTKVVDPSLIIYNAMISTDSFNTTHFVSNGDQTDTVVDEYRNREARLSISDRFMDALLTREFEPDAPNFTPRITGYTFTPLQREPGINEGTYGYSIIRRSPTTGHAEHTFGGGDLADMPDGAGVCFHTYAGDGEPLPSFEGSPYAVPLLQTSGEIAGSIWESLDPENRVAIAAKTIDRKTGEVKTTIINQLES